MRFGADDVEVLFEHLDWNELEAESEGRPRMHLKLRIDVGPVLPQGGAQKADWSLDMIRRHLMWLLGDVLAGG